MVAPRPQLLTVKEASAAARVSATVVYGWVADGSLPAYKVGASGKRGKILISTADFDARLEACRTEAPVARRAIVAARPPKGRAGALPLRHIQVD